MGGVCGFTFAPIPWSWGSSCGLGWLWWIPLLSHMNRISSPVFPLFCTANEKICLLVDSSESPSDPCVCIVESGDLSVRPVCSPCSFTGFRQKPRARECAHLRVLGDGVVEDHRCRWPIVRSYQSQRRDDGPNLGTHTHAGFTGGRTVSLLLGHARSCRAPAHGPRELANPRSTQ